MSDPEVIDQTVFPRYFKNDRDGLIVVNRADPPDHIIPTLVNELGWAEISQAEYERRKEQAAWS